MKAWIITRTASNKNKLGAGPLSMTCMLLLLQHVPTAPPRDRQSWLYMHVYADWFMLVVQKLLSPTFLKFSAVGHTVASSYWKGTSHGVLYCTVETSMLILWIHSTTWCGYGLCHHGTTKHTSKTTQVKKIFNALEFYRNFARTFFICDKHE